ncbi:MAG: FkbM family methyltransferase [Pirellulaceae bacterium]
MSGPQNWKTPLRNACLRLRNKIATTGTEETELMADYDVDVVLDVGANIGQYARKLIRSGYRGRIVSFEPLPDAFATLSESRRGIPQWQVENFALGGENATATLNVAGNSMSSSLQGMCEEHVDAAPESAYVASIDVQVKRLDDVFRQYVKAGERCYLKLDVQGHEHHVLAGAAGCLDSILAIQMELSMEHLYEGQQLWQDSIASMHSLGYRLMTMEPGFRDRRTGVMLQADGIFVRDSAIEAKKLAA